jgi:hypothetical protein
VARKECDDLFGVNRKQTALYGHPLSRMPFELEVRGGPCRRVPSTFRRPAPGMLRRLPPASCGHSAPPVEWPLGCEHAGYVASTRWASLASSTGARGVSTGTTGSPATAGTIGSTDEPGTGHS